MLLLLNVFLNERYIHLYGGYVKKTNLLTQIVVLLNVHIM